MLKRLTPCAALALLVVLTMIVPARSPGADRPLLFCDPFKSALCQSLIALYEFEEDSDWARTSDVGGARFFEPDGANVARSATHKTGTYALAHTASANNYVYIPRTVGLSGTFTSAFWINVDTLPSATTKRVQVLSTRNSLGAEGYPRIYMYNNAGTTVFRYEVKQAINDTVSTLTSTQAISASTWYLVTFGQYPNAFAGGGATPYQQAIWMEVNGGTRNTLNITYADVATPGDFIVGGWLNTSPTEYGAYKVDQLAVWMATLSPADVDKLYNSGGGKAFPYVD